MDNSDIILDKHQKDAVTGISNTLEKNSKCLVKMFCGTGKTRIVFSVMLTKKFTVIVFPSIALITQFNNDYILNPEWRDVLKNKNIMSICSKDEIFDTKIRYTTDIDSIKAFISKNDNKIISITYQSLHTLIKALDKKEQIDYLIFDEAHHIIGNAVQKMVFTNNKDSIGKFVKKSIFLTATPKNENGITMMDRDNPQNADCGPVAFDYTHYQAVKDNICRDFSTKIYTYSENTYPNIYKSIARGMLSSGNFRVLTFHFRSETEHQNRTDVSSFVADRDQIYKEFMHILKTEYPERKIRTFTVNGITASTYNRQAILKEFDETPDDCVYILASCKTIGEGVDTRNANGLVFIDAKRSYSDIIQNIGRICRNTQRKSGAKKSTVIIPSYIDLEKYVGVDNKYKTDEEIFRRDIIDSGNFDSILNILSALRYNDPATYNLYLNNPDKYTYSEIVENLKLYGYDIQQTRDIYETMKIATGNENYLFGQKRDRFDDGIDNSDKLAQFPNIHIELHTNKIGKYIQYINESNSQPVKMYYDDNSDKYYPIVETGPKQTKIIPPIRTKFEIEIEANSAIKNSLGIRSMAGFTKKVMSTYIENTAMIKQSTQNSFEETFEKLREWVKENNRIPCNKSKNKIEHKFGLWVENKKRNYDKGLLHKNQIEKLQQLKGWKWLPPLSFNDVYNKYIEFIHKHKRKPIVGSSNAAENQLANWAVSNAGAIA